MVQGHPRRAVAQTFAGRPMQCRQRRRYILACCWRDLSSRSTRTHRHLRLRCTSRLPQTGERHLPSADATFVCARWRKRTHDTSIQYIGMSLLNGTPSRCVTCAISRSLYDDVPSNTLDNSTVMERRKMHAHTYRIHGKRRKHFHLQRLSSCRTAECLKEHKVCVQHTSNQLNNQHANVSKIHQAQKQRNQAIGTVFHFHSATDNQRTKLEFSNKSWGVACGHGQKQTLSSVQKQQR